MSSPLHATVVARWFSGQGWRAVVLRGASGVGKSDLALRLVGAGWRLVADDYAHLFASGDGLYACPPDRIRGRIEVRGVGILSIPTLDIARVVLVLDLAAGPVERLPEHETATICGVVLPRLRLDPREASAGEKVAAAIARL
ncbi:HPr kinase/phosphorylase [Brevundimonas sp. M20]|uniref:HPr kinase/phosphorylase n=1 Tax=Brevundimonas sp. M20 TaxID=2591463 RepID=UPI001147871F|nr:HPr kinase/phosphatase C-terminal domain-containing protein [Brevundimonas sp. M20]QDH72217.1 serine kinase [Brevundimonas sp. M20]